MKINKELIDTLKSFGLHSVSFYGTVADGVIDDTEAIKKAIANTPINGKLTFPVGTYKITDTILIESKKIDFGGSTIIYEGDTSKFAIICNITANNGIENIELKCNSIDTVNLTHGINFGGGNGYVKDIVVTGFTGISLAVGGGGVDEYSGIMLPASRKSYYNNISNINVKSTFGWNILLYKANANKFSNISTFPYNGLNQISPINYNCIDELVIDGLSNVFSRVSLEASPSNRKVFFSDGANTNSIDVLYLESNVRWETPPNPRIEASSKSSSNKIDIVRHPYNSKSVIDNGTCNCINIAPSYYINGASYNQPFISDNLIQNGNFINSNIDGWNNYSVNSILTFTTPYFAGKSLRIDVNGGRPNLTQKINECPDIASERFSGENITISAWIKTNIPDVRLRMNGKVNHVCLSDEEWNFISSTIKTTNNTDDLIAQIITESSNVKGYIEISNICAVMGVNARAF